MLLKEGIQLQLQQQQWQQQIIKQEVYGDVFLVIQMYQQDMF